MYITTSSIYLRWTRSLAVATAIRVLNSTKSRKHCTFTEANRVVQRTADSRVDLLRMHRGRLSAVALFRRSDLPFILHNK